MASAEGDNVVTLSGVAGGFSMSDNAELFEWLADWAERIKSDGNAKSLTLVIETLDGHLYQVSQSLSGANDKARVVGLLHMITHRVIDGAGKYPL